MPDGLLDMLSGLVTEPVVILDAEARLRDANPAFCAMVRRARQDVVGQELASLVEDEPAELERQLRTWRRCRSAMPGMLTWRDRAGNGVRMRCDGASCGDGGAVIRCRTPSEAVSQFAALNEKIGALTQEITRRQVVERELAEQREWLAVVLRSIGDAVVATDAAGRVVFMNPVAEELTGWAADRAEGRRVEEVFDIVNQETRQPVESPVVRVLRDGAVVGLANHTVLRRRDGREIPIDDSGAPIRREGREIEGAVLVFRDIAERYRAEAALREREARFRQMADYAPVLIWISGVDKACTWFNRPWLEFTGRTLEQEYGYGWAEGVHPDDMDRCVGTYTEAFDARQRFRMEYRLRRHDGAYRWVLDHGQPLFEGERFVGYIGSCIDINELVDARAALEGHRSLLEQQVRERTNELHATYERLRATERMASLGTLSAGLGHDIGNLLMPMAARLRALRTPQVSPEAGEHLEVMEQCLDYLRKLTGGLRMLAQDPARRTAHERTDMAEWWEEVQPLLRNVLPKSARLEARLGADLPPVAMSRPGLTQVVFNLVQNAGDVLRGREGGAVLVEAEAGVGDRLRLSVSDNGPGMSEEVRRRCLEPFFTTKPREFSTGLGLALVHGIVSGAGGELAVASTEGEGTTFTLTLPTLGAAPARGGGSRPAAMLSLADARMAALARAALTGLGWRLLDDTASAEKMGKVGGDDDLVLWVTEAATPGQLKDFLGMNERRRVVLVCDGEGEGGDPRVVRILRQAGAAELRRRVKELASALSEGRPVG